MSETCKQVMLKKYMLQWMPASNTNWIQVLTIIFQCHYTKLNLILMLEILYQYKMCSILSILEILHLMIQIGTFRILIRCFIMKT